MFSSIAGTSTIDLVHSLNGTALLGSTTSSAFGFRTAGVERVRILSNGNVGVGLSTAGYKLDVAGDINASVALRVNRTSNGRTFDSTNGSSNVALYHFNNGDSYFGSTTANSLVLQTSNVARMTIDPLGAISGISSLTATALIATSTLEVNGSSISAADLAYLSGITPGTVTASKALIVDSNKDIAGLGIIRSNGIAITPTNYTLTSPNIPGCLWRTDSTRLCAFREIDSNNWSWGYSGGGVWNDILTMSNSNYRITINGDLNYTGSLRSSGTVVLDSSRNLTTADITAADITATSITTPLANIRDNAQAHNTRIEYLSLGRSSSGSDHGSWSFMNYYSSSTQGDSNYITFGPRLRTGLTSGWGFCMTQNGNCSFQDKNSNSGVGGFKIQANIVGTVDIQGGITRTIGAGHGYLQANSGSPAAYNASSVSTRIGLFVENSIWCSDKLYASSDRRLKRDIEPIPLDEAKKLLNVQAVSYRWKKDTEDNMPEIGCIAQDLLEAGLAPLVSFCPNDNKEIFPEGYQLGLQYSRLPIYMIELIKDLYRRIEALEERPIGATVNIRKPLKRSNF